MHVLYEDNHILAVNKPAGILTQPDDTGRANLEDFAKQYIKEKSQKPGNVFLHAVHRLDMPVSGIVIFAKTSKALSRLNESMRKGEFTKIYHAWVENEPQVAEAEVHHFLLRDDEGMHIVDSKIPGAKESFLKYRVLKKMEPGALLEVHLITGRHHQIRLQLAAIGCPIVGDEKYGAKTHLENGIGLSHQSISFPHPTTKQLLTISL